VLVPVVLFAVLCVLPPVAGAAARVDFDDVENAPANFGEAAPLYDRYASRGVTFTGPNEASGGAILNETSSFGVTGHSPPNFLAFNTEASYLGTGGTPSGPETMSFGRPAKSASIKVGSATPGTVTLTALDGSQTVDESSTPTSTAVTLLTVAAPRITSVRLSFTSTQLVADDLDYDFPPLLRRLKLAPAKFRAAQSGPSVAAVPRGATVSFWLSEASAVRFTVQRKTTGRKVGGKCVKRRRSNRDHRRCTRWVRKPGSFTIDGDPADNDFKFRGRVGGRTLAPGRYRLNARAKDPNGNKSPVRRKRFRITR